MSFLFAEFAYLSLFGQFISDYAGLALRLALGLIMVVHGWPKIKDLKATAANFSGMGFKPGSFWGPLVAIVEFFGGLAVIFGLWANVAALIIAVEFVVIVIWKLAKHQPLVGGWEFDLLILAAALILLAGGGGVYSIDRLLVPLGF